MAGIGSCLCARKDSDVRPRAVVNKVARVNGVGHLSELMRQNLGESDSHSDWGEQGYVV